MLGEQGATSSGVSGEMGCSGNWRDAGIEGIGEVGCSENRSCGYRGQRGDGTLGEEGTLEQGEKEPS